MILKELRKKYIGKVIDEESLDDDFYISTDKNGRYLHIRTGDEYVYEASVYLDEQNVITGISRMTARMLVGDEATHVNYKPYRVHADDYDILDDCLEFIILEDEDEAP